MARGVATLPAGSRITDYISLGVIAKSFPLSRVHSVLAATNRASARQRDVPAQVVVYYVVALALYMESSYREVLRCLLDPTPPASSIADAISIVKRTVLGLARDRHQYLLQLLVEFAPYLAHSHVAKLVEKG
jgi:hypothetical protein